jgi:hypothetical protein
MNQKKGVLMASQRKDFRAGNLRGFSTKLPLTWISPGRMSNRAYESMLSDMEGAYQVYVVFSWDTPIAWTGNDGQWIFTDQTYSQSTTRQLNKIEMACSPAICLSLSDNAL